MTPLIIQQRAPEWLKTNLQHYFKSIILLIQILIFCLISALPPINWSWLSCLKQDIHQYHLTQGKANYWISRPVMLYAHIPMEQINSELVPQYWLVNTQTLQNKHANFLIIEDESFDPNIILQYKGPPTKILICPPMLPSLNPLQIWLYP